MEAATKPHIGKNIRFFRELRGLKQHALAVRLKVDQGTISRWESSNEFEEDRLQEVADALEISVETLKNFNSDSVIYNVQNNYDHSTNHQAHQQPVFNPIEKLEALYERLLNSEKEKLELVERQNQILLDLFKKLP